MPFEGSSAGMHTSSEVRLDSVSSFLGYSYSHNAEPPLLAQDYPATHFEALIAPFQQPLPSIIVNVLSLLARLTAHFPCLGRTPPPTLRFSYPLFLALAPPRYTFVILISNIFALSMLWSLSYSHLLAGKMRQATSRPVPLAAGLVVLPL